MVSPSRPQNSWPAISIEHGALVDEGVVGAVGVNHPDAVDLLPRAFVAVHEEFGIGGREEEVVDPVGGVEEGLEVAGLLAVRAGLEAEGEEDEGQAGGEAGGHHLALVERLVVGALGGAADAVVGCAGGLGRSGDGGGAVFLAGGRAFDVGAGDEGFVGVDADDAHAVGVGYLGHVDELGDGAGVGVGLVDGGDAGGVGGGVEDAVGFVADDHGVDDAGGARPLGGVPSACGGLATSSLVARVARSSTWMPSGAV